MQKSFRRPICLFSLIRISQLQIRLMCMTQFLTTIYHTYIVDYSQPLKGMTRSLHEYLPVITCEHYLVCVACVLSSNIQVLFEERRKI